MLARHSRRAWSHVRCSSSVVQTGGQRIAFVQGSSRGIGLGFVKHLLARPNYTVIAGTRDPSDALALQELVAQHGEDRLLIVGVDVLDESSISSATSWIDDEFGRLDLAVSCAGMLKVAEHQLPEKTMRHLSHAGMKATFGTNVFGPVLVGKHTMPLLRRGIEPKFAALSAKVGSITDNRAGGWFSYRASKAALNMMLKTMAIEMSRYQPQVTVLSLHPGTTDTALSKPFQASVPKDRLFSVDFAVEKLMGVIDRSTPEHSGRFFAYSGEELPY